MEKDNKTNQLRLSQRKIFPNLRKTYSASRNFITLSKVEIDKNVYTMESTNSNFMARQITTSFSHKRIISGVNSRQIIQSQMSKTYRNFLEPNTEKRKSQNMIKQKSVSISNLATQNKQHTDRNQQVPLIQKAKISTKPIGIIQGYSVNSHPGSLSTNNEDRICVITNLNKSILKDTQISFFSIYDGKNGVAKAEYFRDHFHNVLIKDKDFNRDLEISIRRSILLMQQNFAKVSSQLESIPVSSTNLLICIIMDHCAYIASMGDNKMVISTKKGKEIINPLLIKQGGIKKSASKLKLKVPKVSVSMVKLELKELDFIVLGSEGLFQNLSEIQIGNKIWYELLERITKNFHLALGQSTNTIMKDVFQQTSTKNVSLILIAFANTYSCFEQNSVLDLPFVTFATPTCIDEF